MDAQLKKRRRLNVLAHPTYCPLHPSDAVFRFGYFPTTRSSDHVTGPPLVNDDQEALSYIHDTVRVPQTNDGSVLLYDYETVITNAPALFKHW